LIHALTLGHLDPDAVALRKVVVRKSIDMGIVNRLLREFGQADVQGRWKLGGCTVEFHAGYLSVPWLGGRTNRIAEEFALRLHRETGCLIADREHGRVISVDQLRGLTPRVVTA
jgi:hypothetical protein